MGEKIRILICDDEPRTRQALKALFRAREMASEGYLTPRIQVIGEAKEGREAVQFVKKFHPEVVVIDARMPGMGGIEAASQIKRYWPDIKVVMLTMYSNERQAAVEAGVDAFLIKGCHAEALFEAILT